MESQLYVQRVLAIIAVICVPVMFFFKPIIKNFFIKSDDSSSIHEVTIRDQEEESKFLLDESR